MQVYRDGKSEVAVFKGKKYRRYPNGKRQSTRDYFKYSNSEGKTKSLHVAIYEQATGKKVPEEYHIHHEDGNPLNNEISNLLCLSSSEHLRMHAKEYHKNNKDFVKANLAAIRPLTKEWHASEEGRKWHSEHASEAFKTREAVQFKCEVCGEPYETKHRGTTRFCSNKCKSKWRRDSGIDNIEKTCKTCGKPFTTNKYSKARFCSKKCSCGI